MSSFWEKVVDWERSPVYKLYAQFKAKQIIKQLPDGVLSIDQASQGLTKLGKPVVEVLIDNLDYEDVGDENDTWKLRYAIVQALGNIKDSGATVPLIERLAHEDLAVISYVIEALGKIGDDRAVEPLIDMLSASDSTHRDTARRALEKIAEKGIGIDILKIQKALREFVDKQPTEAKRKEAQKEATSLWVKIMDGIRKGRTKAEKGILSEGLPKAPANVKCRIVRMQRRSLNG